MTIIYVAVSKETQRWGADVGLTKHIYKLGFAEGESKIAAEQAIAALNQENHAGAADWKLIKFQPVEGVDETTAYDRLGKRERMADPGYYPHLKRRARHLQAQAGQCRGADAGAPRHG